MEEIEVAIDFADQLPVHLTRLAVALACGLALGIERERKDKPAGLRTILLICMGSALMMTISVLMPYAHLWPDTTRVDPTRIAEGIVTGIGFLGAGTIIQSRVFVQGLTTAAVIWVSAGIGMCAGLGYIVMAFIFTGVVLLALVAMEPLRNVIGHLGNRFEVTIVTPNDSLVLDRVRYLLEGHGVKGSDIVRRVDADEVQLRFIYHGYTAAVQRLLEGISRIDGVRGERLSE